MATDEDRWDTDKTHVFNLCESVARISSQLPLLRQQGRPQKTMACPTGSEKRA
jgi:hypothetical protein